MKIKMSRYYPEFLRYYDMAATQQWECNLGIVPHNQGTVTDPLMRNVELYDVVNRKFAGFTQIILDLWYGTSPSHPYAHKLHDVRRPICEAADDNLELWGMEEWMYLFIVHRVTGSGINYARKPSGYNNTILPTLAKCRTVHDMMMAIKHRPRNTSIFTSVGYQFPAFPKKVGPYELGGDYFLCEYAPRLAQGLSNMLRRTNCGQKWSLREVGHWMWDWNKNNELRAYKFQYAAVVADIADFFPHLVDVTSPFFYGTNAEECISYLAEPKERGPKELFLDAVMEHIRIDTGANPYDAEDVCCDFIRWLENYVRPGHDYDHLDRDKVFNSSTILDHPFGRQKAMLEHGLIKSFNDLTVHPSDDYVLSMANMSKQDYVFKVNGLD